MAQNSTPASPAAARSPLFVDEQGQPLRFYMKPDPLKFAVEVYLKKYGGHLLNGYRPDAIVLVSPSHVAEYSKPNVKGNFYRMEFVKDSVRLKSLQRLEDYRIKPAASAKRNRPNISGTSRSSFTPAEDVAILDYVTTSGLQRGGNNLYRQMEEKRVTNHSWQSMRHRYLSTLQHMPEAEIDQLKQAVSGRKRSSTQVEERPHKRSKLDDLDPIENSQPTVVHDELEQTDDVNEPQPAPHVPPPPPDEFDHLRQSVSAERRKRVQAAVQTLTQETGLHQHVVYYALMTTSGSVSDARRFLKGDTADLKLWTFQEDNDLVQQGYTDTGKAQLPADKLIRQRLRFLEQ